MKVEDKEQLNYPMKGQLILMSLFLMGLLHSALLCRMTNILLHLFSGSQLPTVLAPSYPQPRSPIIVTCCLFFFVLIDSPVIRLLSCLIAFFSGQAVRPGRCLPTAFLSWRLPQTWQGCPVYYIFRGTFFKEDFTLSVCFGSGYGLVNIIKVSLKLFHKSLLLWMKNCIFGKEAHLDNLFSFKQVYWVKQRNKPIYQNH